MSLTKTAFAAMALMLGLAACSRSNDDAPAADDRGDPVQSEPVATELPAMPDAQADAAEPDTNLADATPPPIPPAPDEQMMDDASATGMTARTSREEEAADEEATTNKAEAAERR